MGDNGDDSQMRLTPAEALQLVSSFFEKEWPQTKASEVELQTVTGGFVNSLHLLTRSNTVSLEPACVLIRHFGKSGILQEPPESNTTLSATEQAIICYEMGRRGWGSKLYGAFHGGRLEEYVESHPLTAAESMQPSIRCDVSRSYARLHSLQLPLQKRRFDLAVEELKHGAKKEEVVQKILAVKGPEATEFASIFRDIDWIVELEWLCTLFRKHNCKATIAIGDTNFLNVLVKDYESDCRIVLIDYETAMYSYRGIDIGGHFNDRMYRWSHDGSKLTGYTSPDIDEQRSFCESYLQEMRDLGLEMEAHDTVDHLLLEARIGRMYQILFSILIGAIFGMPEDPYELAGLSHMVTIYRHLKHSFIEDQQTRPG